MTKQPTLDARLAEYYRATTRQLYPAWILALTPEQAHALPAPNAAHGIDTMTTEDTKQARRKDWQIYRLNSDMHAALEESGGELTPEVEDIEARIAENATELADLGASTIKHAKAMQAAVSDEQKRLADIKAYWVRVEALGKRWCRIAATELGEKMEVGVHTIRLQRAPARAVQVWEALEVEQRDELLRLGLGRLDFAPDKRKILAALKAGQDAPGFVLEASPEKVVVVK